MTENFAHGRHRYASLGVVANLPSELIDSVWEIIDFDLKGVIPLTNVLFFDLLDTNGKVTIQFSQALSDFQLAVDLPFPYSPDYPTQLFAYDDGTKETILLPQEAHS